MSFRTIEWRDNKVIMIDQTKLPSEEVYNEYSDFQGVAEAIRGMIIRGAPAIGIAAAMGVALAPGTSSPIPSIRSTASWKTSATSSAAPGRPR